MEQISRVFQDPWLCLILVEWAPCRAWVVVLSAEPRAWLFLSFPRVRPSEIQTAPRLLKGGASSPFLCFLLFFAPPKIHPMDVSAKSYPRHCLQYQLVTFLHVGLSIMEVHQLHFCCNKGFPQVCFFNYVNPVIRNKDFCCFFFVSIWAKFLSLSR